MSSPSDRHNLSILPKSKKKPARKPIGLPSSPLESKTVKRAAAETSTQSKKYRRIDDSRIDHISIGSDSDFKDFQPDDYLEFDDHGELCLVFNILIMFCLVHHSIADNRLSESGLDGFFNSRVSSTPIKKKRESPIKNFDGDYALAASIYPNSP